MEITQREAQNVDDLTEVWSYLPVFRCVVCCQYIESKGAHEQKREEENQEHLEVQHNSFDHCHNLTESDEDPHKEEELDKTQDDDQNEDNFGYESPRAHQLEHDVQVPKPDVQYVNVVPRIIQVLSSLPNSLVAIIHSRVYQESGQSK